MRYGYFKFGLPSNRLQMKCITVQSICSLLPGNQISISKNLARRGVVVSGGWSNGSGWQQTSSPRHWGHSTMHRVPPVSGTTTTMHTLYTRKCITNKDTQPVKWSTGHKINGWSLSFVKHTKNVYQEGGSYLAIQPAKYHKYRKEKKTRVYNPQERKCL